MIERTKRSANAFRLGDRGGNRITAVFDSAIRLVAEVELPSDQLTVPAQQRIGRDDRAKLEQNLAWDAKRLARQQRTLLVREAKRASLEALAQHAVLGFQVLDNNKLLTADPAGEQEDDEGQWRRLQIHPSSLARRARSCLSSGPKASTEYLDTTTTSATLFRHGPSIPCTSSPLPGERRERVCQCKAREGEEGLVLCRGRSSGGD